MVETATMGEPEHLPEPVRRLKRPDDRLRRALRNMLDNTAPDATPRSVRQQAEDALAGK